ncbi:MAG: IclR family transcriptional regulator [Candidatus Promineifilaceae bacterium]
MIQSIQRAAAILRSFTETEPELGVIELSRRLDLHKSTVSRILTTLQAEGLVGQNPETGKYRLGVGLISLAGVALGRLNVRAVTQPHLNGLVEVSQETVNVAVQDGRECVNVERVASPRQIRYVGWIGRRMPLHCTAAGKVMLTFMEPSEREMLIGGPLTRYTEKTVTTKPQMEADLSLVCQQGYAIVHEEFEAEFSAIAAPVFNYARKVAGVVSISGPTSRVGPGQIENFIEPLMETTRKASAEMGYL